jgi:hypothetical protein
VIHYSTIVALNLPMTKGGGDKITPQADIFNATAESLGVKRCALMTFPEYAGATRRQLYGVFNCFRLSNMAAAKREIYFFIVFFT